MSAIILLIGFSLLIAVGFLISFIFSVRSGQYDDTYTPAVRILLDSPTSNSSPKRRRTVTVELDSEKVSESILSEKSETEIISNHDNLLNQRSIVFTNEPMNSNK